MSDSAPKGLGDTIDRITTATGIKKAVKFLAGEDCGCDQRKKVLNKKFRYKKPECLLEYEYDFISEIIESGVGRLESEWSRFTTGFSGKTESRRTVTLVLLIVYSNH